MKVSWGSEAAEDVVVMKPSQMFLQICRETAEKFSASLSDSCAPATGNAPRKHAATAKYPDIHVADTRWQPKCWRDREPMPRDSEPVARAKVHCQHAPGKR